jgi:ABC-type bacteriocin/lantibiotic exporter with double-glycine peptidase domain
VWRSRTEALSIAEMKNRSQFQMLLAALFAVGAVVCMIRHEWLMAVVACAVVVLALVAAYRRRNRPDA